MQVVRAGLDSLARRFPGGPRGNRQLTALLGALLLAGILAELATLFLGLQRTLPWHIALGVALVPIVLLKLAATGWRMLRYYTHAPAYRAEGPPRPAQSPAPRVRRPRTGPHPASRGRRVRARHRRSGRCRGGAGGRPMGRGRAARPRRLKTSDRRPSGAMRKRGAAWRGSLGQRNCGGAEPAFVEASQCEVRVEDGVVQATRGGGVSDEGQRGTGSLECTRDLVVRS